MPATPVTITLKSITKSGVLYTTKDEQSKAANAEQLPTEEGTKKVADVTVDGTKAILTFANDYQTPVNITLGASGDSDGPCTTLSTSKLPTGSTVTLDATGFTAATIGTTVYEAKEGSITVDASGNATVEPGEAVMIGETTYTATEDTGTQVFTADGKPMAIADYIAKKTDCRLHDCA
jgi:hypothetical protein